MEGGAGAVGHGGSEKFQQGRLFPLQFIEEDTPAEVGPGFLFGMAAHHLKQGMTWGDPLKTGVGFTDAALKGNAVIASGQGEETPLPALGQLM